MRGSLNVDVSRVQPAARQAVGESAAAFIAHTRPWFVGLVVQGSAVIGGFVPGCSDIDLTLYLDDEAFAEGGALPLDVILAIQQDLAEIDPAPFGYIQCFARSARSEMRGPIPGNYRLIAGELPVAEFTPAQMHDNATSALAALVPVPPETLLWHGAGHLRAAVRQVCVWVSHIFYRVLFLRRGDDLSVWSLPKAQVIELTAQDEPLGHAVRRFYDAVGAYFPEQESVERALAVVRRGVDVLNEAKRWWEDGGRSGGAERMDQAGLDRKGRLELAREICARAVAARPGEIVLGGVYGSTGLETDTSWSDLEVLLVARDGGKVEEQNFVYRGCAVGVTVVEKSTLESALGHEPLAWPFWMSTLSSLRVLYGSAEQARALLELGQAMPAARLRDALRDSLSWLTIEAYGRVLSCAERDQDRSVPMAVMQLLNEMKFLLCLLNRRWLTRSHFEGICLYENLVETFAFEKLPSGWRELVPRVWLAHDVDETVSHVRALVQNFWQLLADEGIEPAGHYETIDEVRLWR